MKNRFLHVFITAVYGSILMIVYIIEISDRWAYTGFKQIDSLLAALISISAVVLFSAFIPYRFDTRSFLLTVTHYSFLIPSFIILASNGLNSEYFGVLLLAYLLLFSLSALPFRSFKMARFTKKTFLSIIIFSLVLTVIIMAGFGGLKTFNLNVFRVYEFRREAATDLPKLFGYIFFGVSKVIAPMALALALYFHSRFFLYISIIMIIMLFGMTNHKSVLFLPLFVMIFYLALLRTNNLLLIEYFFLGVALVSISEISYLFLTESSEVGVYNTLIIRRGLFVPPLVDSMYLDFFSERGKLYWSTSKFGLGIASNPYDLAAQFVIGREYFGREETSANAGIIGSGFSHAGFIGVAVYSALAGLLLAFLQAYGRVIGHEFVSAASLSVFMSVVTSTDFATAIFTHGLLLLIILLMLFPKKKNRTGKFSWDTNDYPLQHSPPAR